MTFRSRFACLVASSVVALTTSAVSATLGGAAPHGCAPTARAMHLSAQREADARFWLRIGESTSQPDAALARSWRAAMRERGLALSTAREQHDARLQVCALFGDAPYAPTIVPSDFSATVDNPYYPLVPGRTLVYQKRTRDGVKRVEVTTRATTVDIGGVLCRAVDTLETIDGELVEESRQWFAQAHDGAVWRFGESALRYDDGFLTNLDGSWRHGVGSARAGIVVPAAPTIGVPFRRALALGAAEDVATVRALRVQADVPFGSFSDGVEIEEWTPLELLELVIEIFVPGIGLALEVDSETGERLELVDVIEAPR